MATLENHTAAIKECAIKMITALMERGTEGRHYLEAICVILQSNVLDAPTLNTIQQYMKNYSKRAAGFL
jgi:hypothetical protein